MAKNEKGRRAIPGHSFIVELWAKVFALLAKISLFHWVSKLGKPASYWFVDAWVLGHTLLAGLLIWLVPKLDTSWFTTVAIAYGAARCFEMLVYHVNVLLFDEYRNRKAGKEYKVRGYRRLVLLLLHNFLELIFWFALFYRMMTAEMLPEPINPDSVSSSINFSFVIMTSFGLPGMQPNTSFAQAVVLAESMIGLFLAVMILARFMGMLPSPQSKDPHEN
jgi:hypothetical protein